VGCRRGPASLSLCLSCGTRFCSICGGKRLEESGKSDLINNNRLKFAATSDWSRREKLVNGLRRMGVDWRERRLIANLYLGQKVNVRIEGEYSEPGPIGRGVRQGCPLLPLLFNLYIEELIREALKNTEEEAKVGGKIVKALRFADDQAMLVGRQ